MALVNAYATLPEAKGWVGLTDSQDDSLLEDIITAVSRWIDNYTSRQFWQTAAGTARIFDSHDGQCLYIDDVVIITAVKTDENNDGVFEVTWAGTDYQLLPLNPAAGPETRPYNELRAVASRWFPLPLGGTFASRLGLVQITGTWGWPSIPQTVNQACRMQVSREFKRKQSPEGVAGWGDFGPMRISGRLDPDVAQLLGPYRLPVVA